MVRKGAHHSSLIGVVPPQLRLASVCYMDAEHGRNRKRGVFGGNVNQATMVSTGSVARLTHPSAQSPSWNRHVGQSGQLLVTRSASVRLMKPFLAFLRADWRRSLTPLSWAALPMARALPPWRMISWMRSVMGMTW